MFFPSMVTAVSVRGSNPLFQTMTATISTAHTTPTTVYRILLRRASRETEAPALQRQVDRMAVQQDLRRLSWERDFDDCAAHLQRMMTLLRDFLALPRESQQLQLDTFRDAGIEEISQAENFLSRQLG